MGDAVELRRPGTVISASPIGAVTLAPHPEFALLVTDHLVEAQEFVAELDSINWPTEASRNRYCGSGCTGATATHTYAWAASSYFRSDFGTWPNSSTRTAPTPSRSTASSTSACGTAA